MSFTTHHVHLSVRGALGWDDQLLDDLLPSLTFNGETITDRAAVRRILAEMLARGVECIRVGTECDNFDPKTGCQGHPSNEEII